MRSLPVLARIGAILFGLGFVLSLLDMAGRGAIVPRPVGPAVIMGLLAVGAAVFIIGNRKTRQQGRPRNLL